MTDPTKFAAAPVLTLDALVELMEREGFRVYYRDLDGSVHTDCPPEILSRLLSGRLEYSRD